MKIIGKLSDQWQTPSWLFESLDSRFNFVVDVCATQENSKCPFFIDNALIENCCWSFLAKSASQLSDFEESFADPSVGSYFMNPPYSNSAPFIKRAWEESEDYPIVCLLKADASTKWWGTFWDYSTQQPRVGCRIEYPSYKNKNQGRRVKFDPPSKLILEQYLEEGSDKDKALAIKLLDGEITTPAFPSAIVIFDRRHLRDK
jgi:phage N-6-adenine-methyltransferase